MLNDFGESGETLFIPNDIGKDTIRNVMKDHGFSYRQLANMLKTRGMGITEMSLKSKVNRGTFSANFFFECMLAMNVRSLEWRD
jgi:hypothetical protein